MTTAAVVYRSRSGTTRRYAEEIGAFLRSSGIETSVLSVGEADLASLADVDLLLLGCWTNGLFVILQHPDGPWLSFVGQLPTLEHAKVGLFTTYRLLTGSMFDKMREALGSRVRGIDVELKSRDGRLSDADRRALTALIRSAGSVVGDGPA